MKPSAMKSAMTSSHAREPRCRSYAQDRILTLLLVKAAKAYPDTTITLLKGEKSAKATQLMKLMGLGVKGGDEITVTAEGPSEEGAIAAMEAFFRANL